MLSKNVLQKFDKEVFKKEVRDNIKVLFRKNLEEANQQQIFQAVAYAVKDVIVDNWMTTQKEYEKQDPKTVYYMSMEFLVGILLESYRHYLQKKLPAYADSPNLRVRK